MEARIGTCLPFGAAVAFFCRFGIVRAVESDPVILVVEIVCQKWLTLPRVSALS